MHMTTPSPSIRRSVLLVLLLSSFADMALAQVQIIDRPYRQVQRLEGPQGNELFLPATVQPTLMAAAPAPVQRFDVLVEDKKLSYALWRWAQVEGLELFYEAPKDIVAVRASYRGTFQHAITSAMLDTSSSGYPLHACRYDNAIRILHTSQTCPVK